MPTLESLAVADQPELWRSLGFAVDDHGIAMIDGVACVCGAEGRGVTAWTLAGVKDLSDDGIDGLVTASAATSMDLSGFPNHPNGVVGLDHLVISTPVVTRTVAALEDAGFELRRTRITGRDGSIVQAFFKAGQVVVELVGPADAKDDGPASFYGLAFTVADLDATAAFLGNRLRPAKEAVQPGRRIATLDWAAGSSVRIAFMSA